MNLDQIALQLYTIHAHVQTPADIRKSLKRVREIGYRTVQASGLGPIAEEELNEIVAGEGLRICATHESAATIREQPEKVVERLRQLNCRYTAYAYPVNVDWTKPEQVESLVSDLDRAGAVLREAGQVLTYHNHAIEFIPYGGATALDYIYSRTDPKNLQAELDTYWVQYGGGDPVAWLRKLKNRVPLLHLKDYTFTTENKPDFAPIGRGNLDWTAILAAARDAGTEWYIVEQDSTPGDPFDAVRESFEFLSTCGFFQ